MAHEGRFAILVPGLGSKEEGCADYPIVDILKRSLCYFILCTVLVSCTTLPARRSALVPDQSHLSLDSKKGVDSKKESKVLRPTVKKASRSSTPTSSSYFHTLRGLKYEQDQFSNAGVGNLRLALKEYLTALQEDPEAFFLLKRVAILLNRMGKHERAVHFAKRAVKLHPGDTEILDLLGDIYLTSGKADKALKAFTEIIRIAPERSDAYYRVGLIHANRKEFDLAEKRIIQGIETGVASSLGYYYLGKVSMSRDRPEKGLEYLEKAVALNKFLEPAYLEIAMIHEREKRPRDAIGIYRHILEEINPRNREAMHRFVALLLEGGSADEALEFLHTLAGNDPSNVDISLEMVRAWVEKKDYARAIGRLLSVVRTVPGEISLRVYLASLYEQNKQFEEALSVYQKVLIEKPDAYAVRIRLGALHYYRLNNIEAALFQGDTAQEIDPGRVESYIFRGLVLFDAEKYEGAARIFKDGIQVSPKSADLHFHLGAVYDKLGRFEDLVFEMKKVIALDANHANALNYLGYTYAEKGIRLNEAIELVNRALVVRPDDGYFIDTLGWAYYKKGMTKDALIVLQKAASLVPDDPVIHEHLGEVYLGENKIDLAREAWAQSLLLNPDNLELISRFKKAGFGAPVLKDRFQRANIMSEEAPDQSGTSNQTIPSDAIH
ncbi:MAG: tetratricopeptide repeat protein [Nitrospiria bacterium]